MCECVCDVSGETSKAESSSKTNYGLPVLLSISEDTHHV